MFVSLALALSLATAQANVTPNAPVSEVVVVGKKRPPEAIPDEVKRFVGVPDDLLLARWYDPPCPAVAGLGEAQNNKLTSEMVSVMSSVDVKAGDASCKPNIFIFVSSDPDALAEEMTKMPRHFFVRDRANEIRSNLKVPRPVRWKLSSDVKLSTGERPKVLPIENADGGHYVYGEDHARGDRLRGSFREDLSNVVVLVDIKDIDGIGFHALASYLTMVSLAQIRGNTDFYHIDTIMNLFRSTDAKDARPSGFTLWDRRFIRGLYSLDPESKAETQRYRIADTIKRNAEAR